jgi:release factor glutamine methyltransferase
LLAFGLGIDRGRLVLRERVSAAEGARFLELVARRADREPLQYLTGVAPFRHLLLSVGPGVFIPRPETELLADAALTALAAIEGPVVVDLCSGSGALALAIASEAPAARVYAVELSPSAVDYLRRNAADTSVMVVQGDVGDSAILAELDGSVDVVVSNPPYVPSGAPVSPEVRHDPAAAVFAGADGLALMPTIAATARRLLRAGGLLVLEHDETHGSALAAQLVATGWLKVAEHRDLTGRARYVTALRASGGAG